MFTRRLLLSATLLGAGVLSSGLMRAQDAPPSIQVTGAVKQPLTLSAEDLAKMPCGWARTINNGMETVYEGVWLHEILKRAGVPQGGELDPAFIDNDILVADTANGKPLFGAQGRFRLVVLRDMLTKLEVAQVRK